MRKQTSRKTDFDKTNKIHYKTSIQHYASKLVARRNY